MWMFCYFCINNKTLCFNLQANRCLKRAEQSAHVARGVVIHKGKHDGVHERNHVLGAVGRDAQQHIGAEHVEQENKVEYAGNVEHCEWVGL
jgi:hypothetical protein